MLTTRPIKYYTIIKNNNNNHNKIIKIYLNYYIEINRGLGGLGVMCSPQDPTFAGSNPAEFDGFFQDVKILSKSPPGGTLSLGS